MPNNVKNTTFPGLLDLLAPHSCRGCGHIGNVLCDRCKNYILSIRKNLCPICKHENHTGTCTNCANNPTLNSLPPTFIIGERTELLSDLIHAFKYQSIRALANPLAELMNASLPTITTKTYIVPLPTISRHIRTRGFDHTLLVAKRLAKLYPNSTVAKLLVRNNNTVQVGSDANTRIVQANSAYIINPKIKVDPSATYILLDDVWTTGASLRSATKKLQQAGANNVILAILSLSRID